MGLDGADGGPGLGDAECGVDDAVVALEGEGDGLVEADDRRAPEGSECSGECRWHGGSRVAERIYGWLEEGEEGTG